jgi:hypothetical protein
MSNELVNRKEKPLNCFVLRTSSTPKYINIDTKYVYKKLIVRNSKNKHILDKADITFEGNYFIVWDNVFRLERKYFKTDDKKSNKFTFNYRISTDGSSCSILLINKAFMKGEKEIINNKEVQAKPHKIEKPKNYIDNPYVDNLTSLEKQDLLKTKTNFIGIDPGKIDLIYATNGKTIEKERNKQNWTTLTVQKPVTVNYSQARRRHELHISQSRKILELKKKNTYYMINQVTGEILSSKIPKEGYKSVQELETELTFCNSKSCMIDDIKKYIKKKNEINSILTDFYNQKCHRNNRFKKFVLTQKSEANMINRFEETLGSPDDTIVFFGDFEQKTQMKNKDPTKGKSLRKLFTDRGYTLLLVNEFRTSCRSFIDGREMDKFQKVKNPTLIKLEKQLSQETNDKKKEEIKEKISKTREIVRCHGLLREKRDQRNNKQKMTIINRDYNGSMNIRNKGIGILNGGSGPSWLLRDNTTIVKDQHPSIKHLVTQPNCQERIDKLP